MKKKLLDYAPPEVEMLALETEPCMDNVSGNEAFNDMPVVVLIDEL
ncbi:MAG: hypothetical protein IK008_05375 [Bacteroidales bacterium]|nr:hypothetical protein [Bacteroidales bacterium]